MNWESWHAYKEIMSEQVNITTYRVVQEVLTNIGSHAASASRVRVHLQRVRDSGSGMDTLQVVVQDNGQGFDPAETQNGLGLLGMRERAIAAGGAFVLDSSPGKGTLVHISLPIKPQQERRRR